MTSMEIIQELDHKVRARVPIIHVSTFEESRFKMAAAAVFKKREILCWSATEGFVDEKKEEQINPEATDIVEALEWIKAKVKKEEELVAIIILQDIQPYLEVPIVRRHIRDLAEFLPHTKTSLILLSPHMDIPADLEKAISIMEFPLPTEEEMFKIAQAVDHNNKHRIKKKHDKEQIQNVASACLGLTYGEAENVLALSVSKHGRFDIKEITDEKKQLIKKADLDYREPEHNLDHLGGMDELKGYISRVKKAMYDPAAKDFPLPAPKGILLVSTPGCGKSALCDAVAAELQVPLVGFDLGNLMGSLVGETEHKVRNALQRINSIGRCVVRLDEVEKMLGGTTGPSTDSGTSQRALGQILTWMQDRRSNAYIIATANDVRSLPEAFVRKGRFDEIWFIDLPDAMQRIEIFSIHLKKRKRTGHYDLKGVVDACEGFSGAEIEQVVIDALFQAFYENRDLEYTDLMEAAQKTNPLSQTMKEKLENVRNWAKTRARNAAAPEVKAKKKRERTLI